MTTKSGSVFGDRNRTRIWDFGKTTVKTSPDPGNINLFHSTSWAWVLFNSLLAISLSFSSGIIAHLLADGRERAGPVVNFRLKTPDKLAPLHHGKSFHSLLGEFIRRLQAKIDD